MRHCFVVCIVAVLASACGTDPEAEVTADAGAAPAEKPERVVSTLHGKPTAPIQLDYDVKSKPAVGEPTEIEITASTPLAGPLQLTLATRNSIELGANQAPSIDFGAQQAGAETRHRTTVTVVPSAEGRSFLLVTATVPGADNAATRLLAIPVQVGDVPRKLSPSGVVIGEGEETVISLPADESG
ncbi:MAG: hypothetical protein AAFX44_12715 [Pseudomonadota bacterium]